MWFCSLHALPFTCPVVFLCAGLHESSVSLLGSVLQGMPAAGFGASSIIAIRAVAVLLKLHVCLAYAAGFLKEDCNGMLASHSEVLLPRFIRFAAPLAQLVQQCAAMLPAAADQGLVVLQVAASVFDLQQELASLAAQRIYVADSSEAYVLLMRAYDRVLPSNHIASGCLQLLWAYTHVLYEQHLAAAGAARGDQLQQQQEPVMQQPAGSRSSANAAASTSGGSSSTSSGSSSRARRAVHAELFEIVPLHWRMKLFPAAGRQLYLQTVRESIGIDLKLVAAGIGEAADGLYKHLRAVQAVQSQQQRQPLDDALATCSTEAERSAAYDTFNKQPALPVPESQSPALLAPAVLLVVEVLMLLAALYERDAAAEGSVPLASPSEPLARCALLLRQQLGMLTACHSAGFSIRRSVVLRQSGQQLLQLLRWQLQRAVQQRGMQQDVDSSLQKAQDRAMFGTDYMEVVRQQLAQLLCAAGVDGSDVAPEGE
jgi:hypothetical protein